MTMENPKTENVSTKSLDESGWKLTPYYLDLEPLEFKGSSPAIQNLSGDAFELAGFKLIPASSMTVIAFDEALEKMKTLAGQMKSGIKLKRSRELVSLAQQAVAKSAESEGEDIEEWAKRLLADIKGASD